MSSLRLKPKTSAMPGLPGGAAPAGPPPLPRAAREATAKPLTGVERPPRPAHADGFPPDHEIGSLGKIAVWGLATLLFGGGLVAWFALFGFVERRLGSMSDGLWISASTEGTQALSASSLGAAEVEDLEFISNQLGIDSALLGLPSANPAPDATGVPTVESSTVDASPTLELVEDWPVLELTGVMLGNDDRGGSVIVNGILVRVGQKIRGVRVLSVKDNAAQFSYDGRTVWLYSGQRAGRQ